MPNPFPLLETDDDLLTLELKARRDDGLGLADTLALIECLKATAGERDDAETHRSSGYWRGGVGPGSRSRRMSRRTLRPGHVGEQS